MKLEFADIDEIDYYANARPYAVSEPNGCYSIGPSVNDPNLWYARCCSDNSLIAGPAKVDSETIDEPPQELVDAANKHFSDFLKKPMTMQQAFEAAGRGCMVRNNVDSNIYKFLSDPVDPGDKDADNFVCIDEQRPKGYWQEYGGSGWCDATFDRETTEADWYFHIEE